ncbi:MAG: hypothetical protein ABSE70_07670 [Candidatus Limnocylindrales bacterium]
MTRSQPAAPSTRGANPALLLIGGIVIAAIVGVVVFVSVIGKSGSSSSTGSSSPSVGTSSGLPAVGSITRNVSTLSCSSPVASTSMIHLPASVHEGDIVTVTLDGHNVGSQAVEPGGELAQLADGSWLETSVGTVEIMQSMCAAGAVWGYTDALTPGVHTQRVLDSNGNVLAEGSYTVTP